ncbi:MAG: dTMP kinase [Candidatus Levybacteria bacterium CG_4_10_14_0_2_um_filter_36_16]|nr:MAG: dTMP kinase [Candidatus Levybacteria bacterium CG2_30_37_29]PIZ97599.1 MAG: dTMP kinase [Candidatus Levybacteria bacterium CG_4_10_14_0_2_um_filter_36_16]
MKYPVKFEIELQKNSYSGLYVALEGIDGCGKTTQLDKLSEYFKKQGREVVVTREPRKSGIIGDLVQKVLIGEEKLPAVSIQYLFSADRAANHQEIVLPSLKKGKVVISDRCFWSAVVYGILDRTGGKYDKKDADLLLMTQSILSMYHQFTVPDFTFYLKIPLKESMKRLRLKKDVKEIYEDESKISKVLTGYEYLKNRFPDAITEVDGNQTVEKVTKEMIRLISN